MNGEERLLELLRQIGADVHAVRINTERLAKDSYIQDLNKIASTPERQEIWRRSEGNLSTEELAAAIGISVRSVQYFLQDAESLNLIQYARRGYPKRSDSFNLIPSDWKPFRRPQTSELSALSKQETGQP